jgi:hypothetical protein
MTPDGILGAIARRPGSPAADLGPTMRVAAHLRALKAAGHAVAEGPSPCRWYPTAAGQEVANRQTLQLLRVRSKDARRQRLAVVRRAEDLAVFTQTLTDPSPPCLVAYGERRQLTFRELAATLSASVGLEVIVSTDIGRVCPQPHPITAVGTIDRVEEDRSPAVGDWLLTVTVGETAFVEFSRRHFTSAKEQPRLGEIWVSQGVQATTIAFLGGED